MVKYYHIIILDAQCLERFILYVTQEHHLTLVGETQYRNSPFLSVGFDGIR